MKNMSVIVTNIIHRTPVFELIKNILIADSSLYFFEYQVYDTVGFSPDFLFLLLGSRFSFI